MHWPGTLQYRWRLVFLVDVSHDTVAPIPGYGFAEDFARYAAAVFAEDPSLHEEFRAEVTRLRSHRKLSLPSGSLLRELEECALLLRLNLHLVDYFSEPYGPPGGGRVARVGHLAGDRFSAVLQTNRPRRSRRTWAALPQSTH